MAVARAVLVFLASTANAWMPDSNARILVKHSKEQSIYILYLRNVENGNSYNRCLVLKVYLNSIRKLEILKFLSNLDQTRIELISKPGEIVPVYRIL